MFSAWTLVSLYNIASQDAQEDFTFVDEDDDSHMTWAEITVETYDVDPNDKSEFDTDSFRVRARPPNPKHGFETRQSHGSRDPARGLYYSRS